MSHDAALALRELPRRSPMSTRAVFPLVPTTRLLGLAFGAVESVRRGRGSDVAGARPYVPGDAVQGIDWKASARLSTARGSDEFVVLERHAEEAPRVVVLCDRRPEMGVFSDGWPWLSKPVAAAGIVELVIESTLAAHGLFGYLDLARTDGDEAFWRPPRGQADRWEVEERVRRAGFDAAPDSLAVALEQLVRRRRDLPAGSFVFVVSDFLRPPPRAAWARIQARRWDVVPVVVQDPVWEQDFPAIAGISTPVLDPVRGALAAVRLSEDEVAARRAANRRRLRELRDDLESLGMGPVLVSSADRDDILRAFLDWSERRGAERGRVW
jgi:uncharacterized protein (DUF58 family)